MDELEIVSQRKVESGEFSAVGEIGATDDVLLRHIKYDKLLVAPDTLPKHPIRLKVELGGNIPVQPFVFIKYGVDIECPIDITQISIPDAIEQMKEIAMNEARKMANELREGLFVHQVVKKQTQGDPELEQDYTECAEE